MVLNRSSILVIFLIASISLSAQDRYVVFFKDKANSIYSTSEPLEFLSQRAIDRRTKQSIDITDQDFPVNQAYLDELNSAGTQVYFTSRWMNAALVEMSTNLESTILGLSSVESIEYVAPGSQLSFIKDDFSISENFVVPSSIQATTDRQIEMLRADQMHADGFRGEGMLIAVFDGGFFGVNDNSAFELIHTENRIVSELDFVRNFGNPYRYSDHGTSVLSCIAGFHEGSFVGTAPNADFILAVTEDASSEYRVEEYNWLFAAEYADSAGVDVINSSLGYSTFDDPDMNYTYEEMDGQTALISRAANMASEKGMLVVNSAGNSGDSFWHFISAPADSPHVLTVGAVDKGQVMASFSSFGPSSDGRIKPDVSALGLLTTVVNGTGNIVRNSGTSFASPLIAGFAASMWQAYPGLTNIELMSLIKNSSTHAANPNNDIGYGVPSYLEVQGSSESSENVFNVYPNPMSFSITIERLSQMAVAYTLVDLKGKTQKQGMLKPSESQIEIDPTMKAGLYFLQLKSGDLLETIKLLKK